MSDLNIIELWLLDGSYKLACEPQNVARVEAAGQQLEQRFRDVRSANPRMDNQKVAVMTALQLMQELITAQTGLQDMSQAQMHIEQIIAKIEASLH